MFKYGDVVKVSKGFYSLPHQVDRALSILTARVMAINQTTSISRKKSKKKIREPKKRTRTQRLTKKARTPYQEFPHNLIISTLDAIIQEDLERCGGACHAVVKRLTKKIAKRIGVRSNRKLTQKVVHILNRDSRATLWDIGHSRGRTGVALSERVYSLSAEGVSSTTFSKHKQREQSVRERILNLFTNEIVLTPKKIVDLLELRSSQVSHTLSSLASTNDLMRVKTGYYCLPGNGKIALKQIDVMRNPITIEQIQKVLSEVSPLTPGSISKRLQTSYSLVFNALNRFVEEKQIVRIKRGFYCLPNQVEENQRESIETDPIIRALIESYPQTPLQISERIGRPRSSVGGSLRKMTKEGFIVKIRYGLYCLPDQVEESKLKLQKVLDVQTIRRKSQTITIIDAIKEVVTLLLTTNEMSVFELENITGVPIYTIENTIQRLTDHSVLTKSEIGFVSFAPQDTLDRIKVFQMIAESDSWTEVICSLISEYIKKHRISTGRNIQRLFRIRRFVLSQLYFLHSTESQKPFNEAIDTLCLEGKLERLDGDQYKFNQLS